MVVPVPKDTWSYCLRAAGEEGLTQGQVQGELLGCPLCKSLSIPYAPLLFWDAV